MAAGRCLADALCRLPARACIVYLQGELGAGKTTFARGVLAGLGHVGRVPSPTYTLIEPYELAGRRIYHIDLYRLRDPREVDDLGVPELLEGAFCALIEWPDHGTGHLPAPDLVIRLDFAPEGRRLRLEPRSPQGHGLLAVLHDRGEQVRDD